MRIGGYMTVRNEEALVELAVRWHLDVQGFDRLIVVDDQSTDDTRGILRRIRDPRLQLRHIPPGVQHGQSLGCSNAAKELLSRHGCDWVLPIDADEFWVSRSHSSVRAALETIHPETRVLVTHGYRFQETALDPPEADFRRKQQYARLEGKANRRVVLHGSLSGRFRALVLGNHVAQFTPGPTPIHEEAPPELLARYHYRHASRELFRQKIALQGAAFSAHYGKAWLEEPGDRSPRVQRWYRSLLEGRFDEEYARAFVLTKAQTSRQLADGRLHHLTEISNATPVSEEWRGSRAGERQECWLAPEVREAAAIPASAEAVNS